MLWYNLIFQGVYNNSFGFKFFSGYLTWRIYISVDDGFNTQYTPVSTITLGLIT